MPGVASSRPSPDHHGCEWRSFADDVATVSGAVAAVMSSFGLVRDGDDATHWRAGQWELALSIDVGAEPRGGGTTVGVRIFPEGEEPGRPPRRVGANLAKFVGGLAVALAIAWSVVEPGDTALVIGVVLVPVVVTLGLVLVCSTIPDRRRDRRRAEWSRAWRGAFWAALEARLPVGRGYRGSAPE